LKIAKLNQKTARFVVNPVCDQRLWGILQEAQLISFDSPFIKEKSVNLFQTHQDTKKPPQGGFFVSKSSLADSEIVGGGVDGTRTRDPRRDRPVF
jgi:hypothetical protein